MILLDWTRMGKWYCLAGAVVEGGGYRIVRPLQAKFREAPVRNVGWSAYLLDGHVRWEVFEIVGPQPAEPQPPHLEDLWVRGLRPRQRLADPAQRREILEATRNRTAEPTFGQALTLTRSAAYLPPGTGQRSLATTVVAPDRVTFTGLWREGAGEPDYRVSLGVPGLEGRSLPVKDHHLLCRIEHAAADLDGRLRELNAAVQQMGEQVAVRLGLSRAFQGDPGRAPAACWLMADGFFSLTDPQP
jgi:hypothetical protein